LTGSDDELPRRAIVPRLPVAAGARIGAAARGGGLTMAIACVREVLIGSAVPYTRPGSSSAIGKSAVAGAVAVDSEGLAGDQHGDPRVHGGPDKAIHCYSWSHYQTWLQELPGHARLAQAGAFGENLSVEGLDEHSVCIGDRCRIGTTMVEVSQGRQPCWKLNDRFAVPDMARRVQDSLRAGWYLRMIAAGHIRAGDAIVVQHRPFAQWTIARLLALIRDRTCDPLALREVLALPLPAAWQRLFAARLHSGCVESWQARME